MEPRILEKGAGATSPPREALGTSLASGQGVCHGELTVARQHRGPGSTSWGRLVLCWSLCSHRGLERRGVRRQKRGGAPLWRRLGRRAGGVGVPAGGRFWKGMGQEWWRQGCAGRCEYSPAAAACSLWARIPSPQAGSDLPAGAGKEPWVPGQPRRGGDIVTGVYTGESYTVSQVFWQPSACTFAAAPERGLVLLVCCWGAPWGLHSARGYPAFEGWLLLVPVCRGLRAGKSVANLEAPVTSF